MQELQTTITRDVSVTGRGLFTGQPVTLTFEPAEPNTGIVFVREHEGKTSSIPAHVKYLTQRTRRTAIKSGSLSVETIEHCMAALAGLAIDNAVVRVVGGTTGELPAGDGSGQPFVDALLRAQPRVQDAQRQLLIISKPLQVSHGDATLAALPGPTDHLEVIYDFEAPPPIGRQTIAFRLGPQYDGRTTAVDDFVEQLAPARTFVFQHEVEQLRAAGLGTHLTERDLLVISPTGPLDNKFRFPDECARHKVLDLIGDIFLTGRHIRGRIIAHKSGHDLNHALARKLVEQEDARGRVALLGRDGVMDIRKIQKILPHRYPMLLVDRVLEMTGTDRALGIKNVTFNDVFFQGHFPGTPIFPGVLIVEALAQLGGLLLSAKLEHTGKIAVLLSLDGVKIRHPVVPGDQLILEAVAVRVKARTGHIRAKAFVGDKLAAEAEIKFMLVDAENS